MIQINDYEEWKGLNCRIISKDIHVILNEYIRDLNTIRLIKGKQLFNTNSPRYNIIVNQFNYFLDKLINPFEYNYYQKVYETVNEYNKIFEKEYLPIISNSQIKTKKKKKVNKNKAWTVVESKDIFTNEINYIYENIITGEKIISKDTNLLSSLNKTNKPKKEKNKIKYNFTNVRWDFSNNKREYDESLIP